MTVRNAVESDVEKLAVLFDAYRVFYEKESNLSEAKNFYSTKLPIKNRG